MYYKGTIRIGIHDEFNDQFAMHYILEGCISDYSVGFPEWCALAETLSML